jgi:hypothetical protein
MLTGHGGRCVPGNATRSKGRRRRSLNRSDVREQRVHGWESIRLNYGKVKDIVSSAEKVGQLIIAQDGVKLTDFGEHRLALHSIRTFGHHEQCYRKSQKGESEQAVLTPVGSSYQSWMSVI